MNHIKSHHSMGSSSLGMQENPSSSGTAKQHMPFQQAGAQAVHCFSGRQYILDHMRTRFDSGFTQSRRSCTSIPRGSIHHTMDSSGKSLAEAISCRTNCLTNPVLKKKKKYLNSFSCIFRLLPVVLDTYQKKKHKKRYKE